MINTSETLKKFRSALNETLFWLFRWHMRHKALVISWSLFALLFVIFAILDETRFVAHVFIFWMGISLWIVPTEYLLELGIARCISMMNRKWKLDFILKEDQTHQKSKLALLFFWLFIVLVYNIQGKFKLLLSLYFIVAFFRLFWPLLLAGSFLSATFFALVFFSEMKLIATWMGAVLGIVTVLLFGVIYLIKSKKIRMDLLKRNKQQEGTETLLHNQDDTTSLASTAPERLSVASMAPSVSILEPAAFGLVLAPALVAIVGVLFYWTLLSINPFWLDGDEVSKGMPLTSYDKNVSLNATIVRSQGDFSKYENYSHYPVVIKPNICTTSSRSVKKCPDYQCILAYYENRKLAKEEDSWVIQNYQEGQEAVVFYFRYPYMDKGRIKTIGVRTKSRDEEGNLSANYFTTDSDDIITESITKFFDKQADALPGYHGGRFDCMFESIELAKKGKGIHILETNIFPLGCISEKVDQSKFVFFRKTRTNLLQMWIGATSILSGKSDNFRKFVYTVPKLVERYYKCSNMEALWAVP